MATLTLNAAELAFLGALVKDRLEDLDDSLQTLNTLRYLMGSEESEEEASILLVRQIHTGIARKIEQAMDVPFQETPREALLS